MHSPLTNIQLPGAFYVNWWYQFQRCDWLRENGNAAWACKYGNEAWYQCPLTCHSCEYDVDDDYYSDEDYDYTLEPLSSSPAIHAPLIVLLILILCISIFPCILCCCKRCSSRRASPEEVLSPSPEEAPQESPAIDAAVPY